VLLVQLICVNKGLTCWVVDGWLRSKATGLDGLFTVEKKDGRWCMKALVENRGCLSKGVY